MIITSTDGYILSVLGPFLADSKNNDASIIKHCLFENQEGVLEWLIDDDVIILDRGFRDAIKPMKMLGFQPAMPNFLTGGKKQFDAVEANRTRCITKVRWVVESGENPLLSSNIVVLVVFNISQRKN
jgi:hypothetical protein